LAGGDFSSGPGPVSVAVSLLGEGPPILGKQGRRRAGEGGREGPWRRSGARPGDCLLVTGDLGGSRARKHLSFLPRLEEARLLRELAAGAVHAAIDVSDGLSRDLNHLCNESRCGVELDARRIPLSRAARASPHPLAAALGDGEDFELLLALAPEAADYVLRHWRHSTPLTRIGRFLSWTEGRWLRTSRGRRVQLPDLGYEHQTGRPKKRGHE
jgi:thiamine-monophosphate kinase